MSPHRTKSDYIERTIEDPDSWNPIRVGVEPPSHVDCLMVHQFDPANPAPGGIMTCLRGMTRYVPPGLDVAVVGVDGRSVANPDSPPERQVGRWEEYALDKDRRLWFLPVTKVDTAAEVRRVPHSLLVMLGVLRYWRRLPDADLVHVHRMDLALALQTLQRKPVVYFIHTQDEGLTSATSDSLWRFAGGWHRRLEQLVARRARTVVVFNQSYSKIVLRWNERARFFPTWFDPHLIVDEKPDRDAHKVDWVGRFEAPKDPELAVTAFTRLAQEDPDSAWTLDLVGCGTLLERVRGLVSTLPVEVAARIRFRGRLSPAEVADSMAGAGVFLMTSHPGYEGYPMVLVEAMASGLPCVVTSGSDTGGLLVEGETGFTCGREPTELARHIRAASILDRSAVRQAVHQFDAPSAVARIFALDHPATPAEEFHESP